MNTERAACLLQGEGNFYGTLNPSVTLRVTGPGCGTQHPLRVVNNTCVLLAAAPTATPFIRHWRRLLLLPLIVGPLA